MRYKIVACILLILSSSSFVLAAPVAVREVREACADAVEGGENLIIVTGKRAPGAYEADSDSDTEGRTSPSQSSSAPDHASGGHSGIDMLSSPSVVSELSWFPKCGPYQGRLRRRWTRMGQLNRGPRPRINQHCPVRLKRFRGGTRRFISLSQISQVPFLSRRPGREIWPNWLRSNCHRSPSQASC